MFGNAALYSKAYTIPSVVVHFLITHVLLCLNQKQLTEQFLASVVDNVAVIDIYRSVFDMSYK